MGIGLAVTDTPNLLAGGSLSQLISLLPGLRAYWPLQESSGSVAAVINPAIALGRNVVLNGDFATDTIWTKSDAALTIGGGTASWSGAQAGNADLTQASLLGASRDYEVVYTVSGRTAGTVTARLGTQAGTARSTNATFTETITANNVDVVFRGDSSFDGSIDDVTVKQVNIPANAPNMDGASTGVVVGQFMSGQLGLAYSFDGAAAFVDIASTVELNSVFDPDAGTLINFLQVSGAGVWTDAVPRIATRVGADANNTANLFKTDTNNTFRANYRVAGNNNLIDATISPTVPFMAAITWDINAAGGNGEVKLSINGVQSGATLTPITGTWVGNVVSAGGGIGTSDAVPSNVWSGLVDHVVLVNRVLSDAELLEIARAGGVA